MMITEDLVEYIRTNCWEPAEQDGECERCSNYGGCCLECEYRNDCPLPCAVEKLHQSYEQKTDNEIAKIIDDKSEENIMYFIAADRIRNLSKQLAAANTEIEKLRREIAYQNKQIARLQEDLSKKTRRGNDEKS